MDKFYHPSDEQWYYFERAVSYDNWLTWRCAIGDWQGDQDVSKDERCFPALTAERAANISSLGSILHQLIAVLVSNIHELQCNPWHVHRWLDFGDPWNTGAAIRFELNDLDHDLLLDLALGHEKIGLVTCGDGTLVAALTEHYQINVCDDLKLVDPL